MARGSVFINPLPDSDSDSATSVPSSFAVSSVLSEQSLLSLISTELRQTIVPLLINYDNIFLEQIVGKGMFNCFIYNHFIQNCLKRVFYKSEKFMWFFFLNVKMV